jgi:uncharacterized membrane protein YfcA
MEIYFWLFFAGLVAFTFSTLAGGGGALILVPIVDSLVGTRAVSPVVHLGNFIGRPTRILLFRKHIDWKVVRYYLPSAILGALLGAWIFSEVDLTYLQIIIAGFLISTLWQFRLGKKKRSFTMPIRGFVPLGFAVAIISTIVGATGPVLNPFYLNYGISKEKLIATKAVNSFFLAIIQLSSFTFFGALHGKMWGYGLAIGAGATIGNFIGKRWLKGISDQLFRQILIAFMAVSGLVMLIKLMIDWFS